MCTPVTLSKQKPYTSHLAIQLHSPGLCEIYVSSLSCQKAIPSGGVQDIKSSRLAITAGSIKKEEQMSI